MRERNEESGGNSTGILLGVLSAVERDSRLTQRHLARELGIALGLANAYLKRCAKKGLIKVREAPVNRYAYYLTPRGFAEKSRLTGQYLTLSLDFFRQVRQDCATLMSDCHARGWRRLVLFGVGEVAEICILSAAEAEVEILCVVDEAAPGSCAGRVVVGDLKAAVLLAGAAGIDAVIVTATQTPQERYSAAVAEAAAAGLPRRRIVAPALLRIVIPHEES